MVKSIIWVLPLNSNSMVIYHQNQNSTLEECLPNNEKNVNIHQIEVSKISTSSNTLFVICVEASMIHEVG